MKVSPFSLETVATDISQDDNGGAQIIVGVVGGATMNARCSERGGHMAGGVGWSYTVSYVPGALRPINGGELWPLAKRAVGYTFSHDHRDIACAIE